LNPNYEILEQILRLDVEAGAATLDWRSAQKELAELAKKTKANEELIAKTRTDMAFMEGDLRRQYKKIDELDERRSDRSARLFAAKNDDEHRALKREVDNLERDTRDAMRRVEESEARIEQLKSILMRAESELTTSLSASVDERKKAQEAEQASSGRLSELGTVRDGYLTRLDDRVGQHYQRVARITRNANGPITRVRDKSCGNCHLSLAPQLLNNIIRGKDIESCPSCNHILLPQNSAS
jgi:predicted  nucleic acid-binding Zn-ribbon protein